MVIGESYADRCLNQAEVRTIVCEALDSLCINGKRVLIIIPDGTRSMPMPLIFSIFEEFLSQRASMLDYLVALGTHPPMSDTQLSKLFGQTVKNGQIGASHIFNHQWQHPDDLIWIGTIPAWEIKQITNGVMAQDVQIQINKMVFDYDQLIICGPVFPHEVVGFSGGNKYFFPGIAGQEIINFTHWLGAILTSYKVIGAGYTPVRAIIDRAASLIDRPKACFAMVVTHAGLAGVYFGSPEEAWQSAASLSAQKHIIYLDKPVQKVLSIMPEMYDDLWTAAKGMYKLEPVLIDGGEIIIFAPQISEVSYTHGQIIDQIGYHCRDYFLLQWDKFKGYPGGVLAHSTHVRGMGVFDPVTGIETPRIQVTLATGIPPVRCAQINLGYMDPDTIHFDEWQNREQDGILVVPRAGEMLYRLKA